MKKTTVYLPDDLKAALERTAVGEGRSEAKLIRQAVRDLTQNLEPPRPRLPLFPGEIQHSPRGLTRNSAASASDHDPG
ncbi:MAG: ribbon-helix-helix domain-containing protein [Actinobacteria bacterium]|nr:ribbon-helix-helix domain-containing protein [Actinomycetota bacterium]